MLITVGILAGILLFRKKLVWIGWAECAKLIGIGCIIAIHWVAFYGSIKKANASIALICLSTASIYSAVIEPYFYKRKLNTIEILTSCIAFIGMLVIYKFEYQYVLGITFGLIAAMLSAVFTMMNKTVVNKYNAQLMAMYEIGGGLIFLIVVAPIYHHFFPQIKIVPHVADWFWLLILAYFCTVLGQSLALHALKKLSTFTIVLTVNLEPVYGIILAFLFYKEGKDLSAAFYYGIALIGLSVGLHTFYMYQQSRKKI
jgi:drug/metabolite transporter (DMT)-like permease